MLELASAPPVCGFHRSTPSKGSSYVRVATWNCNGRFRDEIARALALEADITLSAWSRLVAAGGASDHVPLVVDFEWHGTPQQR